MRWGALTAWMVLAGCGGETVGTARISDGPSDARARPDAAPLSRDARAPGRDPRMPPRRDASTLPPQDGSRADGTAVRHPNDAGLRPAHDASFDSSLEPTEADVPEAAWKPLGGVAYLGPNELDLRIDLKAGFAPAFVQIDVDGEASTHDWRTVFVDEYRRGIDYRLGVSIDPIFVVFYDPCSFVWIDESTHQMRVVVPRGYVDPDHSGHFTLRYDYQGPTSSPQIVDVVPPFGGTPLCSSGQADPGVVAPGTYRDFWTSEGIMYTTELCALSTAGEVTCWGLKDKPLPTIPPAPFDALGAPHSEGLCARRASGDVACWPTFTIVPPVGVFPPPSGGYAKLSPNGPCAILESGDVLCWNTGSVDAGVTLRPGPYVDVSGNQLAGCAVRTTGELDCWGFVPDPDGYRVPEELLVGKFTSIATAGGLACGLRATGDVDCVVQDHPEVLRLHGGPYERLSAAGSICALDAGGIATCVGRVGVPSSRWKAVHTGEYTTPQCGILLDDRLACFGVDTRMVFP